MALIEPAVRSRADRLYLLAAGRPGSKKRSPSIENYYETGLEKDPLWPEGYFNAAMVAGSVQMYALAAEHMERYLLLMPNAPDAQTARDQIDIWKMKAQEK